MRDEVVDGAALNSKWIPMALNGFFDSGDGPMLSFDFAWGKISRSLSHLLMSSCTTWTQRRTLIGII